VNDFTDADLERFLAEDPGGPVVMLNLLRFGADGGRERYDEYRRAFREVPGAGEAEPVYFGTGRHPLESGDGAVWDAVALVRYPSRRAFAAIVRSAEYRSIAHLRNDALADAVLQPTQSLLG
jgi:uncharacterized protein (DUF1330 family)